jgi:hypothetical protein
MAHKCAGCGGYKRCHAIVRFPTNPGTELGYCEDCWSTMFCYLVEPRPQLISCECGQALLPYWSNCHMCGRPQREKANPSAEGR